MLSTFTATLSARDHMADNVYRFRFSTNGHSYDFQPGQYSILHIPQEVPHTDNASSHAAQKTARRLYSMSSSPSQKDSFELLIEIVPEGVASSHLMKMQPGESLTVQGPAGMFTLKQSDRPIVFLATGTGIAPIRSMLISLAEQNAISPDHPVFLYWGFKTASCVYDLEELKSLAVKHPGFQFRLCLSREASLDCIERAEDRKYFQRGHINDTLSSDLKENSTISQYYLCGGPSVVESLKTFLEEMAVPKEQIHFEKFTK